MTAWRFTKGLHDLGNGNWAYLQPDGGWGWSNAGLVTDGECALLVDTLFDERLTAEMLAAMRDATGFAAGDIATLVNTHANGDHTFGNHLLRGAEIIASQASAEEMEELPPAALAQMMTLAEGEDALGAYLRHCFGAFDFAGVRFEKPTRTFSGTLALKVGDKALRLTCVGPAHTQGDVLVHVPEDRVMYTGDILFINGTPIVWAGPVANWLAACDFILEQDLAAIVPGHGPITDRAGVAKVQSYLRYVDAEARARFDAGMSAEAAARDIALGDFSHWGDAERIVVNVHTLYREYGSTAPAPGILQLFTQMAKLRADFRR